MKKYSYKESINKIKFGVNVIFDKDIYRVIDFASKNNFSSIELWPAAPQFSPEKYSQKERRKIAKYAKTKNIQIQFHASEYLSFFANYPTIRKAYFNCLKDEIDFARSIGAVTFTVHQGSTNVFYFPKGKKVPIFRVYPKYFFKIFEENLERVSNYAKSKVVLCIENANDFEEPIMESIEKFLCKNKLFLTWDIAKSYNQNGAIKRQELDFFLRNMKSIKNVHLHDATSKSGHEIIGKGFVDFKFFFKKLKNLDVNYIIEVRPHSNALKSRANLLKILK